MNRTKRLFYSDKCFGGFNLAKTTSKRTFSNCLLVIHSPGWKDERGDARFFFLLDFNSTPQWPICPHPAHGGTSITCDIILMQLQISVGNFWSCQVCPWICFYSHNKMWQATNESGEEFWAAHNVNTQCSNVMKYELWITPHKSGLQTGLEATLARFMNTSNFKCSSLFLWPLTLSPNPGI